MKLFESALKKKLKGAPKALAQELSQDSRQRYRELLEQGMEPAVAQKQVLEELGEVGEIQAALPRRWFRRVDWPMLAFFLVTCYWMTQIPAIRQRAAETYQLRETLLLKMYMEPGFYMGLGYFFTRLTKLARWRLPKGWQIFCLVLGIVLILLLPLYYCFWSRWSGILPYPVFTAYYVMTQHPIILAGAGALLAAYGD